MVASTEPTTLDEVQIQEASDVLCALHLRAQYDIAAEFLAIISRRPDADELLAEWTPEEEKKVKRKVGGYFTPSHRRENY